jgi:fermentation-respiration switch protein FrsA (DUF1100 family)
MFLNHGFIVLVPDSRAHGESGGAIATYGLLEADDVRRWVSWLIDDQHPSQVFGMGESLGGAVLIQSLAVEPRFSAIVAESSFSSFERIARDRVAERLPLPSEIGRLLAAPPVWAGFLYARLRYGLDFRAASPEAAIARSITPVLLIHGLNDAQTPPAHSRILASKRSLNTVLWLVPGAGHTGASSAAPREFESRVLSFFAHVHRSRPIFSPASSTTSPAQPSLGRIPRAILESTLCPSASNKPIRRSRSSTTPARLRHSSPAMASPASAFPPSSIPAASSLFARLTSATG